MVAGMRLPRALLLTRIVAASIAAGLLAIFLIEAIYTGRACKAPAYAAAGGWQCLEFWVNRYQTLLASLIALAAAALAYFSAISTAEQARSDVAADQMRTYSVGIRKVFQAYSDATRFNIDAPSRELAVKTCASVAKSEEMLAALVDPNFGPDVEVLSLFLNRAASALPEHATTLWTAYLDVTAALERKQAFLRQGGRVDELPEMAVIDVGRYREAILAGRPVYPPGIFQ
jgi:hypothetical protein